MEHQRPKVLGADKVAMYTVAAVNFSFDQASDSLPCDLRGQVSIA